MILAFGFLNAGCAEIKNPCSEIRGELAMASSKQTSVVQLVVRSLAALPLMFVLLFVTAGRWDYWQGWLYIGVMTSVLIVQGVLASRNPQLIEERLKPGAGIKGWDKVYFALSTPMYFISLMVGALDTGRWHWSGEWPPVAYGLAVVLYLLGQVIFLWARMTNANFSSVVRIQTERGHTVCKEGPYRYVRHPGYVGGIVWGIAGPMMLGSVWAVVPHVIAALLLVWRTHMEDRTLQVELPGYTEYTRETRYRLLPGVW
jgi:protein-S-isoprenylcysteine O-methyltransferase Ste14